MPQDDDQQRAAANRLYWESDASVAEIAEKLGVSRRALYDAVQPEPTGARCPECSAEVVFRTRTARMLGEAECGECGLEHDIEVLREATAEAGPSLRRSADAREESGVTAPAAEGTAEAASEEAASEPDEAEDDDGVIASEPAAGTAAADAHGFDDDDDEWPEILDADEAFAAADDTPATPGGDEQLEDGPVGPPDAEYEDEWLDELDELAAGPDPWLRDRAAWLGGAALAGVVVGVIAAWFGSRR